MYTINYSIKPTELKTRTFNGKDNLVTHVYWRMTGVDSNGNSGFHDSCTCIANDLGPSTDLSNFVEFEDLTEAAILTWLTDTIDQKVAQEWVKASLHKNAIKDTDHSTMPWEAIDILEES